MPFANAQIIRVLLVEDNPGDAEMIQGLLQDASQVEFVVTRAERFLEAVEQTRAERFDLVLLDLSLPDSHGLYTVINACEQIDDVPIVVLTGNDDDMLGREAVQEGAQDYLIKGQLSCEQLTRTLHYAITRHKMQNNFRATSMLDDLTGLSNRRGFLTLAMQQLKLAHRTGSAFLLLYADIDEFKWINDTFGHQEGDRALIDIAEILRKTFRESDVIGRLGGDEFVIAVLEVSGYCTEALAARLYQSLDLRNAEPNCSYPLLMSVGAVRYIPPYARSIEQMLAEADAAMYFEKRKRKSASVTGQT